MLTYWYKLNILRRLFLNIYFLPLVLLSLTITTRLKAQEHITLQKAIELALARNLVIKQAQLTEAVDNEDFKQSKNNRLPTLNGSSQGAYNFGRSPNLTTYSYTSQSFLYANAQAQASVILFQGGQLTNQILQNRLILDADKSTTAKVKNDLVLNVVTTYLQLLTNLDLVSAAKQQIDISQLILDRVNKTYKAGSSTFADLSQSKAQFSTSQLNLTNVQNQYDLSLLNLKQYMEMNPETELVIEKPDVSTLENIKIEFITNNVISSSLKINPDVKLAESQQRVYAQAINVAKGNYNPVLSLFGSLSTNYSNISRNVIGENSVIEQIGVVQGTNARVFTQLKLPVYSPTYSVINQFSNNFNQSIGVNLQIPIFDRFLTRSNVRKAKLTYKNAELATLIAKNNLTKTIIQALLDLRAAQKSYQAATQTFLANKDAFDVVQQRYLVGFVNSLDYNTSLTNLNKSEFDMIQAKYFMIFKSKVIDYYLGNPISF